jgi:hypothetical protein
LTRSGNLARSRNRRAQPANGWLLLTAVADSFFANAGSGRRWLAPALGGLSDLRGRRAQHPDRDRTEMEFPGSFRLTAPITEKPITETHFSSNKIMPAIEADAHGRQAPPPPLPLTRSGL